MKPTRVDRGSAQVFLQRFYNCLKSAKDPSSKFDRDIFKKENFALDSEFLSPYFSAENILDVIKIFGKGFDPKKPQISMIDAEICEHLAEMLNPENGLLGTDELIQIYLTFQENRPKEIDSPHAFDKFYDGIISLINHRMISQNLDKYLLEHLRFESKKEGFKPFEGSRISEVKLRIKKDAEENTGIEIKFCHGKSKRDKTHQTGLNPLSRSQSLESVHSHDSASSRTSASSASSVKSLPAGDLSAMKDGKGHHILSLDDLAQSFLAREADSPKGSPTQTRGKSFIGSETTLSNSQIL